MKILQKNKIQNWNQDFSCKPQQILFPETEDAIAQIIRDCKRQNQKLRVAGSKYSYMPLIATDAVMVCLDKYSGIEAIDREKMEVTVKAGTRIADLERALYENNLALYNLGDINQQTIAGLVGTGSHGTGLAFGCVSTQISGLRLVTGNGEVVECTPELDPELFKAAQVSLGLLGIVTQFKLKVLPLYYIEQARKLIDFSQAVSKLQESFKQNRNYEFFWFPYTDYVFEKKTNLTNGPIKRRPIKKLVTDYILENGVLWVICELSRRMPKLYRKYANWLIKAFNEDVTLKMSSLDAYATARLVKHAEIEYAIPMENAERALHQVHELLQQHPDHVSFPIEVRCSKQDDIYLSPGYKQDSVWIAVHTYRKDPHESVFRACEQIFLANGGRPHWGKIHWLDQLTLKQAYPEWEKFQTVRRQCDPQQLFLNDYLKALFD